MRIDASHDADLNCNAENVLQIDSLRPGVTYSSIDIYYYQLTYPGCLRQS